MKKLILTILALSLMLSVFSSCSAISPEAEEDSKKLTVVTTVFPVYDWTRSITGDLCNVIYLDERGTDMHSFEPTANVILTLSSADVFIHIGGASDKWVSSALQSADNNEVKTLSLINVASVLTEENVNCEESHHHVEHHHDAEELDEHIWLSLKNAQLSVNSICEVLCQADPDNTSAYKENAESYNAKLLELDNRYTDCVNSAERKILLFADRFPFRYLTEDYGIEYFAAFPGCSAESEASFETLTSLIEKTKSYSLPCILTIEKSTADIAETISNETGAKVLTLNSCQSVTNSDIRAGLTYLDAMENNLQTISEALN